MDDVTQYAADGKNPYTAEKILQAALHLIIIPCDNYNACKKVKAKVAFYNMWTNLKKFFSGEYHEMCDHKRQTEKQS